MSEPSASDKSAKWYALDVEIDVNAREAVEYALMEAGALGTETTLHTVTSYFDSVPDRERVRHELAEALRIYGLPSSSVLEMRLRDVVDRDWLEEWKKSWQPVVVGRFLIAPPWSELDPSLEQLVIRIEPGMAFGTGTHETTRLCLNAIEKNYAGGSFLDVGTGTGILAIAAAKASIAGPIEACDNDAEAIAIAKENALANEVGDRIVFRVGSVDDTTASVDLVCANLTADVIIPLLPKLVGATCGQMILSGILETQVEPVVTALAELGIHKVDIQQDGEWVCIVTC